MANRKFDSSEFERTLRVMIDMDMVLCDFESRLLEIYRDRFPDDPFIPLEKRNCFYARDQYEKLREDLPDKIRSIYNGEGFFTSLPEIDGACAALKEIEEMENVEAFICTSPLVCYDFCLKEKCQWIEEHLGKRWVDKMIIVKDKTLAQGDILIDDRPNIKGSIRKPSWEHIVFTACHNVRAKIGNKKRLENWTDGSWRALIEDFRKRI